MPRRSPGPSEVAWLVANYRSMPLVECAKQIGFCTDTLRRVLVREGVAHYPGAKYSISRTRQTNTWQRPCKRCGCSRPRPKNLFFCEPCRSAVTAESHAFL